MKILTNNQNKKIGGIVRYMNIFLDEIRNFSFELVLATVYIDNDQVANVSAWEEGEMEGCKNYILSTNKNYYNVAFETSDTLADLEMNLSSLIIKYTELLTQEKPDIVWINGTYYRPWCLMKAAKRLKIPYLVSVHGSVSQEGRDLSDSKRKILNAMELDFFTPETLFIFPSRVALEQSHLFTSQQKIRYEIIPNPIDKAFYVNKNINQRSNKVGFVLRWEAVKNTNFILDFIKFNEQSLNPFNIEIITDGKGKLELLGKFNFVKIYEPCDTNHLIDFYKNLDLLVNPSFFETFGYAPAESIVVGTPSLVSNTQGFAEVLRLANLDRYIVDFSDVEKIHNSISVFINMGIEQKEIDKIKTLLSPEIVCKKLTEQFYKLV